MSRCDSVPAGTSAKRPNIIVILSDDMGFSDIGCYGGEIDTPNLDALAADGLRFTQFYNTARCCPTRASLLTRPVSASGGRRAHDGGLGLPRLPGRPEPQLRHHRRGAQAGGLPHLHDRQVARHAVTSAKDGPKHNWPLQRGFDRFYGTIHGRRQLLRPVDARAATTRSSRPQNDPEYKPETYYYTDAISDNAVQVHPRASRDSRRTSRSSCTWPTPRPTGRCTPCEKDIAKYKGKYDEGYDPLPRGSASSG